MTKREIASLAIKLMGVFILLKSIAYVPMAYSGIYYAMQSHDSTGLLQAAFMLMMSTAMAVIPLVSRPGLDEPSDDGKGCCGSSSDWVLGFPQTFIDGAAILAEDMGNPDGVLPAQELQPTGVFDGLIIIVPNLNLHPRHRLSN